MAAPIAEPDWLERLTKAAKAGDIAMFEGQQRDLPADALRQVVTDSQLCVDPRGLRIQNAHISDELDLAHVTFPHPLHFIRCVIDAPITLNGATVKELSFAGSHIQELDLNYAQVIGELNVGDGFQARGEVTACNARIGGDLILNGAALCNADGVALSLDRAQIGGVVCALDDFQADGEVTALNARIGHLALNGAKLRNADGVALFLNGVEVAGGVYAGRGFQADGEVRANNARIGELFLDGGTFRNADGIALALDGVEVAGNIWAGDGFHADGMVSAVSARMAQLILDGASIRNSDGIALALDGVDVAGGVFARDGFEAEGEVRAPAARIGGELNLNGATLRNTNGFALNLYNVDVAGALFAGEGFQADGEVHLQAARVGRELNLNGATMRCANGDAALDLDSSSVNRLRIEATQLEGGLDLYRAAIRDLVTGEEPPGPLEATGWDVSDIHGPLREDWRAARRWLDTSPRSVVSVQPWHSLAAVYERNGDPASARRLRFAAANKVTRQSPWLTKVPRRVYGALVGHGYYPLFALGWLIAVILVGWMLVATARSDIVPTNAKDAAAGVDAPATKTALPAAPITAATPCEFHPGYPCLNSLAFVLNNLAPASVSVGSTYWMIDATWLTLTLDLLKLFAWALAAVLLAGVTGLLRKT